jgi:hypothetical protein
MRSKEMVIINNLVRRFMRTSDEDILMKLREECAERGLVVLLTKSIEGVKIPVQNAPDVGIYTHETSGVTVHSPGTILDLKGVDTDLWLEAIAEVGSFPSNQCRFCGRKEPDGFMVHLNVEDVLIGEPVHLHHAAEL